MIFFYIVESGQILALDLGGTNFRILLITLEGQEVNMESKRDYCTP
jgi:hexokinase